MLDKSLPILGCPDCRTTMGRMGCPVHGQRMFVLDSKQKEKTEISDEEIKDMANIIYESI